MPEERRILIRKRTSSVSESVQHASILGNIFIYCSFEAAHIDQIKSVYGIREKFASYTSDLKYQVQSLLPGELGIHNLQECSINNSLQEKDSAVFFQEQAFENILFFLFDNSSPTEVEVVQRNRMYQLFDSGERHHVQCALKHYFVTSSLILFSKSCMSCGR